MKTIIYPGTFDPITHGHSNLIERASRLFDKVIIAIASSRSKQPLFSFEERQRLCQEATAHCDNIEVVAFSGLIVEQAKQHNACAILRGVRSVTDFDYELQMASMNQNLMPDFETVFLTPANEFSYISSTLVREIASMDGDVSNFVHPKVVAALHQRFLENQA